LGKQLRLSICGVVIIFFMTYLSEILGLISILEVDIYKTAILGNVLQILETLIHHENKENVLLIWVLTGFIIGLISRKPSMGFATSFYASVLVVIMYYILLYVNNLAVLPITIYGQFIFITSILFPLIENGIITSIGGYIGGIITKPRKTIVAHLTEEMINIFPIKCPHCGFEMASNALYCPNCGGEISKSRDVHE